MFSLSNFFGFNGKIDRKTYIISILILIGINMLITFILANFTSVSYDIRKTIQGRDPLGLAITIVFIFSFLMLTVKRGREIGIHWIISVLVGFFLSVITAIVYAILPARTFK